MKAIFTDAGNGGLSLKSILPQSTAIRANDLRFRSCCSHWNECRAGDLFVALVEIDVDGHDFAERALQKGAIGVVTERLLAIDAPQFIVEDSRQALGQICQALAGNPCDLLVTIGVAGSDGKTITNQLITNILLAAGGDPMAVDSLSGSKSLMDPVASEREFTTPSLATTLSHAVIDRKSHAVIELPTQAIAEQQLHATQFDIIVLTNIRRDESQFERSEQTNAQVMSRCLKHLKPMGMVVVNADDPNSQKLLDQLQVPFLTFGIIQEAEVGAKIIEQTANDLTFVINAGNESVMARTAMIGMHHVYNCLAATAVGLILGQDLPTIVRGLERAGQLPGRLEPIQCGQEFLLYVDSARKPNAIATAIHAIRQQTQGKLWVVASVCDQQTIADRRRLGKILEATADQIVLAPLENPQAIDYEPFHQILDGFENSTRPQLILNRFRALEWAMENTKPGDSVLILGGGDRPVAQIQAGRWSVTDGDICRAWLYDRISFAEPSPARPLPDGPPATYFIDDYRKKLK